MAETLGTTQVREEEALTDRQLSGGVFRARKAYEETGDKKYLGFAKNAYSQLKERGGAEYWRVEAAMQLDTDMESINMEEGADLRTRLGYTLMAPGQDGANKGLYLINKFGRDNIRTIEVDGNKRDLIRYGNEWRPVDEVGLTTSDFTVDFARDLPQVVAEIATSFGPGALKHASRIVRFAAPSVAGFTEKVIQDVVMSKAMGVDPDVGNIAATEFALSAGGMGMEGLLRGGARLVTPKAPSSEVKIFGESLERLKKAGVSDLADAAKVKGGWIRKPYISLEEGFHDALERTQRVVQGGTPETFEEGLRRYAKITLDNQDALARKVAATERVNQKRIVSEINDMAQRRLDAMPHGRIDAPHVRGAQGRDLIGQAYKAEKEEASRLFDVALRESDAAGLSVSAKELDETVATTILDSGLPIDQQGQLIAKYAPAQVKKWEGSLEKAYRGKTKRMSKADRQKQELLRQLGETVDDLPDEAVDLTFRDLYDLRGALRKDIKFDVAQDGVTAGPAQPTLKKIDGALTEEMESLAKEGGYLDSFRSANKHFEERVMPFRRGDINKVRKGRDAPGFVTDDNVMSDLLYGKNAADNVRELLRVAGRNSPLAQHIQKELSGRIVSGAKLPSGWVDIPALGKLVDATNPAVWDAAYGPGAHKRIKQLKNVVNINNFDARKGDPRMLEAYMSASSDTEARELLQRIRGFATKQTMQGKYQDKIVKHVIARGDPSMVDPNTVGRALLELDPTELRAFFDTMPDEKMAEAFKTGMMNELIGRSRTVESGAALRAFANGHDILVDPKVLLANLSDRAMRERLGVVLTSTEMSRLKSFASSYGALVEWSARNPRKVNLGVAPYLRTGMDGNVATRFVWSGHPFIDNTIRGMIEKGEPMEKAYQMMWTAIVGTDEAISSTITQMNQDPDYERYVKERIQHLNFMAESPKKEAPAQ